MKILYEDNHLLVVEKPINIPVQADSSKDLDFLSMIRSYVREKYNKPGNVYIGLVHRLDRPVGGLMVFAKTSKAANRLSKQLQSSIFQKTYYAVVCGKILNPKDTWTDYIIKDIQTNTSYIDKKGKKSVLEYHVISYQKNMTLLEIQLYTGRSHQIRVQCASRNYPLYGDQRYNKNAIKGEQIALFSHKVSFLHPITQKRITFSLPLPSRYPFSNFQ